MNINIWFALIYAWSVYILFIYKYQVNRVQYVNKDFFFFLVIHFLIYGNNVMC